MAGLNKLTEHCQFGKSLNDVLSGRLVGSMQSEEIQKQLLTEANLTLNHGI